MEDPQMLKPKKFKVLPRQQLFPDTAHIEKPKQR